MDADDVTSSPGQHWLHANEPKNYDEARKEVLRLQRTIAALVAIGLVSERKARQTYEIAGW